MQYKAHVYDLDSDPEERVCSYTTSLAPGINDFLLVYTSGTKRHYRVGSVRHAIRTYDVGGGSEETMLHVFVTRAEETDALEWAAANNEPQIAAIEHHEPDPADLESLLNDDYVGPEEDGDPTDLREYHLRQVLGDDNVKLLKEMVTRYGRDIEESLHDGSLRLHSNCADYVGSWFRPIFEALRP